MGPRRLYCGDVADDQWLPPPPAWVDPPRRSWRPLVVSTLLVAVVAAVVVIVAAAFLGDDDPDQSEISRAFQSYIDGIEFQSDGFAELTECPIGSPSEWAREASDSVDLSGEVADGEEYSEAYERAADYPALVQCFVTSDMNDGVGPTAFGVSVSELPSGSYRSFLTFDAYTEDVDVSVDVQTRQGIAGLDGDVFGYCYRGEEVSGCGADFVDRENGVALSVYLQGTERTADEAVVALDEVLEGMVDALLDGARSNRVAVTIPSADL
ncbi:MAG: hypothetical protein B7C54_12585 [Acidimicrobiales bacterium mtb01]|nr:MAG: hypothetical protein B7C54_12585 [Acidimicrobiales bacterium mtb01]